MHDLDVQLGQLNEELHSVLRPCATDSVVGMCFVMYRQQPEHKDRLSSPARQVAYLLGVLLSTPEPETPQDFGPEEWEVVVGLLNRLFIAYVDLFIPPQKGAVTEEAKRVREVALTSFLHYFNSDPLASVQQLKSRIETYLVPFDGQIKEALGIGIVDALSIADFIATQLQEHLDRVANQHDELSRQLGSAGEDVEPGSQIGWNERASEFFETLQRIGKINVAEVTRAYPATAHAFWRVYTIRRGEGTVLRYPTEESPFDLRPLIRIDELTAMCISSNSIFSALIEACEQALQQSSSRTAFFRARDKALEFEITGYIRAIMGNRVTVLTSVYETADQKYEHDVVAFDDRLCLVMEAKASPPPEPFRDSERSFIRLRDAFRNPKGIQKAYEQGRRITSRLNAGEVVSLFDERGLQVAQIRPHQSRANFAVCVTRDDFGPLATNLSLLLDKAASEPYPWVVSVLDLSTIAEAWQYLRWNSNELRDYLRKRILVHGTIFSAYELDFAGCYVKYGDFPVVPPAGVLQLGPDHSEIFDEIYAHLHQAGPPVAVRQGKPFIWNFRRSLAAGEVVPVDSPSLTFNRKVGRNEQCPCASGRKFKHCHGK